MILQSVDYIDYFSCEDCNNYSFFETTYPREAVFNFPNELWVNLFPKNHPDTILHNHTFLDLLI